MLIELYTDGSSSCNPGPSGTGFLIRRDENVVKTGGTGYFKSTNNRMEILSVIEGIIEVHRLDEFTGIEVFSDSAYVVDTFNKFWIKSWKRRVDSNGIWHKSDGNIVLNQDLWERLYKLVTSNNVRFTKVKGHSSNPFNNKCDEIAVYNSHNPTINDDGCTK